VDGVQGSGMKDLIFGIVPSIGFSSLPPKIDDRSNLHPLERAVLKINFQAFFKGGFDSLGYFFVRYCLVSRAFHPDPRIGRPPGLDRPSKGRTVLCDFVFHNAPNLNRGSPPRKLFLIYFLPLLGGVRQNSGVQVLSFSV
jgi:hypothetical protein